MADQDQNTADATQPVVIKKYANRRLYNTETSAYVTLDDLAGMVRSDRDFVVRDAKTGDDLTHSVLTQIIVEQEAKSGSPTLLPIPFLRQLIRYYDDSIAKMVPSYLQFSMAALAKEHERYRKQFTNWGPNAFEAYQEQARKNLALFERAMAMWTPNMGETGKDHGGAGQTRNGADEPDASELGASELGASEPGAGDQPPTDMSEKSDGATPDQPLSEIDQLKAELAAMQAKIERISRTSD